MAVTGSFGGNGRIVYWTLPGRLYAAILPLVGIWGIGGRASQHPSWMLNVATLIMFVMVFRAFRSGVLLVGCNLVRRGVLWTRIVPLESIRAAEVSNEVVPLVRGFSFFGIDLGLRIRLHNGRWVDCPVVSGRKTPKLTRELQRQLKTAKIKCRPVGGC